MDKMQDQHSRRDFLQQGSSIAVAGSLAAGIGAPKLSLARSAHVAGSDTIRLGLIGSGNRGAGAACHAMYSEHGNVELIALADIFHDRLDEALETCLDEHPDKVHVTDDNKSVGLDAWKRVLDSDADMVILATPPGFRPLHFENAIEANKHVFMEKPVAVDVPGIRRVLAAGKKAADKGLAVAVGLQRRHERSYRETIEQLKDGIIGRINFSRVYWNSPGVWMKLREPDHTELEYQLRNWYYFNWICGDHIVEQHVHNIDVINWLMDDYPVRAMGQGGRLLRDGNEYGQIFDHHMVEYEYANGHIMISQCRHMKDCTNRVAELVQGTKGSADISAGRIFDLDGKEILKSNEGRGARAGHQQEHLDLFEDLSNGLIPNETEYGARSTMTAILGRLATYSGKELFLDDAMQSEIRLADIDALHSFDDPAPVTPDENLNYPIPVPGDGYKEVIDWTPRRKPSRRDTDNDDEEASEVDKDA